MAHDDQEREQAAIMNLARLKGWIADKPEQPNNLVSFVIQRYVHQPDGVWLL